MQPLRVEGLAEFRRDLKAINRRLVPQLRKAEVKGASVVAIEAARRAPRGNRPLPANRRKRLHESVRPLISGTKIQVGATARTAPHANVNHWGGSIQPRGPGTKPIQFPRRPFVLEAFEATRSQFITLLAAALEELFRETGFH